MSSFTYKWTLDATKLNDFKTAAVMQDVCSPVFSAFGCKWCLATLKQEEEGHACIYIILMSHPPNMGCIETQLTLKSEQFDGVYQLSHTFANCGLANQIAIAGSKTPISAVAYQQVNELSFSTILAVKKVYDSEATDVTSLYMRKHSQAQTGSRLLYDFEWKFTGSLLEQMKHASFRKQFRSKVFYAFGSRWCLIVHPNGYHSEGFVSLYLQSVSLPKKTKSVCIAFTLRCVETNSASDLFFNFRCQHSFPHSFGWKKAILRSDKLQSCESLTFVVDLELITAYGNHDEDVLDVVANQWTEFKKGEKTYELSKEHGDVALVLDTNQDKLSEPPIKRQRLNDENESIKSDQEIQVCSVMLRSESPVFDNLLSNDSMERKERKIMIKSENITDVEDMWYSVCTGVLRPDCNVFNVIALAHMYQLQKLLKECASRLLQDVCVDSLVRTLLSFDRYEIVEDFNKLLLFASENLEILRQRNDWQSLPFSYRRCLIAMRIDPASVDL